MSSRHLKFNTKTNFLICPSNPAPIGALHLSVKGDHILSAAQSQRHNATLDSSLYLFVGKSYALHLQIVHSSNTFPTSCNLSHHHISLGSLQWPLNCLLVTILAPILSDLNIIGKASIQDLNQIMMFPYWIFQKPPSLCKIQRPCNGFSNFTWSVTSLNSPQLLSTLLIWLWTHWPLLSIAHASLPLSVVLPRSSLPPLIPSFNQCHLSCKVFPRQPYLKWLFPHSLKHSCFPALFFSIAFITSQHTVHFTYFFFDIIYLPPPECLFYEGQNFIFCILLYSQQWAVLGT